MHTFKYKWKWMKFIILFKKYKIIKKKFNKQNLNICLQINKIILRKTKQHKKREIILFPFLYIFNFCVMRYV
jgi:hypothetical protein